AVELPFGVCDSRHIRQSVRRKEFLSLPVIYGKMNECDLRTLRFDFLANIPQLGDRLAAKRSTKMPQKDQQHRPLLGQLAERFSSLRPVRIENRLIHALCHFSFRLRAVARSVSLWSYYVAIRTFAAAVSACTPLQPAFPASPAEIHTPPGLPANLNSRSRLGIRGYAPRDEMARTPSHRETFSRVHMRCVPQSNPAKKALPKRVTYFATPFPLCCRPAHPRAPPPRGVSNF